LDQSHIAITTKKVTGKHGMKKSLVVYANEEADRRTNGTCMADEISTICAKKTKCGTVAPFPALI